MGCLSALGVRLLDEAGRPIGPGGGPLADMASIDASGLDPRWQEIEVVIASDVEKPDPGERGAARVFGPQKGADPDMVEQLEENLRHCFTLIHQELGVDMRTTPGGGAAGGFAAGLMAFMPCRLESGIKLVLDHRGFVERLADCELVITGEGQMDTQTLDGKGPIGVAQLAREQGVPTVALVGGLAVDDQLLREAGIDAAFSILDRPMPLQEALDDAQRLLRQARCVWAMCCSCPGNSSGKDVRRLRSGSGRRSANLTTRLYHSLGLPYNSKVNEERRCSELSSN